MTRSSRRRNRGTRVNYNDDDYLNEELLQYHEQEAIVGDQEWYWMEWNAETKNQQNEDTDAGNHATQQQDTDGLYLPTEALTNESHNHEMGEQNPVEGSLPQDNYSASAPTQHTPHQTTISSQAHIDTSASLPNISETQEHSNLTSHTIRPESNNADATTTGTPVENGIHVENESNRESPSSLSAFTSQSTREDANHLQRETLSSPPPPGAESPPPPAHQADRRNHPNNSTSSSDASLENISSSPKASRLKPLCIPTSGNKKRKRETELTTSHKKKPVKPKSDDIKSYSTEGSYIRRTRNTQKQKKKVSASYYLGYVEDEESVEDIMKKFELMEALKSTKKKQTDKENPEEPSQPDPSTKTSNTLPHASSESHTSHTSTIGDGSKNEPNPLSMEKETSPKVLDEEQQEELFRLTYSNRYLESVFASSAFSSKQAAKQNYDYTKRMANIHNYVTGLENEQFDSASSDEEEDWYEQDSDDYYSSPDLYTVSEHDFNEFYANQTEERIHLNDMRSHTKGKHIKRKRRYTADDVGTSSRKRRRTDLSPDPVSKKKILENVGIYVDLKTNETLAMVHKGGRSPNSSLNSPSSVLQHAFGSSTINNATIQSLQSSRAANSLRRSGKSKILKIPSGELPPTWAHRLQCTSHFINVPQKYVKDVEFVEHTDPLAKKQLLDAHSSMQTYESTDILQHFDFSSLPLYNSGGYEAILISPPWKRWNRSMKLLHLIPLEQLMKHRGYVFIWVLKELIPDIFDYFTSKGYIYADNICWVHQQPNLEAQPESVFRQDKSILFLFRKNNKSTKKMNIRHQRTPDTIFDYKEPNQFIYQMIETLLPTTEKSRLHLWSERVEEAPRSSWTCVKEKLSLNWDIEKVLQSVSMIEEHMQQEKTSSSKSDGGYDATNTDDDFVNDEEDEEDEEFVLK